MKIIIDLYYYGNKVDAYKRDVKPPHNCPAYVQIDITALVDGLGAAFAEQREKKKCKSRGKHSTSWDSIRPAISDP